MVRDGRRVVADDSSRTGIVGILVSSAHKLMRLVAVVMPAPLKRMMFRRLLGWQVASDAYVGFSYIDAQSVVLGPGSRIGHFNIVR